MNFKKILSICIFTLSLLVLSMTFSGCASPRANSSYSAAAATNSDLKKMKYS